MVMTNDEELAKKGPPRADITLLGLHPSPAVVVVPPGAQITLKNEDRVAHALSFVSGPAPLPAPYHPIDMGTGTSGMTIQFPCPSTASPPFTIGPSDKHQIFAKCASTGAPPECISA